MSTLREGLRRLVLGRWLFRELRATRQELQGVRQELARIAQVLEAQYQQAYPPQPPVSEADRRIEVTTVSDEAMADWMERELELTRTLRRMPTPEEVGDSFKREGRYPGQPPGSWPGDADPPLGSLPS